jgi:hypothetical protein
MREMPHKGVTMPETTRKSIEFSFKINNLDAGVSVWQ